MGIANSTNLSVKGIIAIAAMAEMSRAVGDIDSLEHYSVRGILVWRDLTALVSPGVD